MSSKILTVGVHFKTTRQNAQPLIDAILETTENMKRSPPKGFLSARLHRSQDGTRVVNYAQWRSPDDYHAFLAERTIDDRSKRIGELAEVDFNIYDTVFLLDLEE